MSLSHNYYLHALHDSRNHIHKIIMRDPQMASWNVINCCENKNLNNDKTNAVETLKTNIRNIYSKKNIEDLLLCFDFNLGFTGYFIAVHREILKCIFELNNEYKVNVVPSLSLVGSGALPYEGDIPKGYEFDRLDSPKPREDLESLLAKKNEQGYSSVSIDFEGEKVEVPFVFFALKDIKKVTTPKRKLESSPCTTPTRTPTKKSSMSSTVLFSSLPPTPASINTNNNSSILLPSSETTLSSPPPKSSNSTSTGIAATSNTDGRKKSGTTPTVTLPTSEDKIILIAKEDRDDEDSFKRLLPLIEEVTNKANKVADKTAKINQALEKDPSQFSETQQNEIKEKTELFTKAHANAMTFFYESLRTADVNNIKKAVSKLENAVNLAPQ